MGSLVSRGGSTTTLSLSLLPRKLQQRRWGGGQGWQDALTPAEPGPHLRGRAAALQTSPGVSPGHQRSGLLGRGQQCQQPPPEGLASCWRGGPDRCHSPGCFTPSPVHPLRHLLRGGRATWWQVGKWGGPRPRPAAKTRCPGADSQLCPTPASQVHLATFLNLASVVAGSLALAVGVADISSPAYRPYFLEELCKHGREEPYRSWEVITRPPYNDERDQEWAKRCQDVLWALVVSGGSSSSTAREGGRQLCPFQDGHPRRGPSK